MIDSDLASIQTSIHAEMKATSLPSLAVAAAFDGEIVWERAFGWANRSRRLRSTVHSPYSLASISKPMTTTALMVLLERGLIDLDAPANKYLGDAKLTAVYGDADGATVRRIANHTSGLPLHYQFFYADEPYHRPSMDETIRRYGTLVRMPGERVQYSNLGFGILDHIISRVSGKPFCDFMREEIFIPLGMLRSCVDLTSDLEPYQAIRYGRDGVSYPMYDFDHPGASAIYSSVHDLIRFGMLHSQTLRPDQSQILKPETIDAMQVLMHKPEERSGFGVGWHVDSECGGVRLISHSGGMGGVSTSLLIVPELKVVVAALANAASALPHRVAEDVLAALAPEFGAERKAIREKRKVERETETKTQPTFEASPTLLGEWIGIVKTPDKDLPITLWFKPAGDVHVRLDDQLKALVNDAQLKDGEFKGVFLGDVGYEDADRRPYHLHFDLALRDDLLTGCILALTVIKGGEGGAPGKRTGNALSFAATLSKTGAE